MSSNAERGPLEDRPSTTTTKLDPGSHTETTPAADTLAAVHGGQRRAAAALRRVLGAVTS
jgi:hypothetical protein